MVDGEGERVLFHVSSVANRDSIAAHGLDWRLMGTARGIAGSTQPEQEGCFVCDDEFEVAWFAETINNTGGAVDVWAITGISEDELVESPDGHRYVPRPVGPVHVRLVRTVPPGEDVELGSGPTSPDAGG